MNSFFTIKLRWAFGIFAIVDTICAGVGMGVPVFCIFLGFLTGWYIARVVAPTTHEIRQLLQKFFLYAVVTSAFTFVLMAIIWGRCIVMLFNPSTDYANLGVPLILYDPRASFIGWLVLMIVISPILQFLTTIAGSHLTLMLRSRDGRQGAQS
ncbi:MAG: hypothetical protein QME66_03490 [Candidatus Eisenbacteria bacterium]|nr:hypothetical protein [Candidatus Eisenbacteria bacterium]